MPSYNIELNSKTIKGSDVHSLLLRITVNRKHARIKMDQAIQPKHFNPRPKQNKYVRSTHKKHAQINSDIVEIIDKAKQAVRDLENDKKLITSATIKDQMVKVNNSSIVEFADSIWIEMEKNEQIGSMKKYKTLVRRLKEIGKNGDVMFVEVDLKFLERFHKYLLDEGNSMITASKYMKAFRTVYGRAKVEGLTRGLTDPFSKYKIKVESASKDRLTETEINAIEALNLKPNSLIWHVRNAFMFSFYCAGIRASDILQLKWRNIVDGRLIYKMHKTNRPHSLKLVEQAEAILSLYENVGPEEYIFPFFTTREDYSDPTFRFNRIGAKTALLNKYLKLIAKQGGINKKVSTHTARHSFADIARQKTDNIYNLSKTLGHSSINITEAYLASFDEKAVDDTLDQVFQHK